jgi:hypothetical protein
VKQAFFRIVMLATLAVPASAFAQSATADKQAQTPAPAAAPAAPIDYSDPKTWLCRPGRAGDACDVDMTTTVVAADGTLTKETWAANPKAAIDCFYVYPTISTDPGDNSDMTADPAELNVVAQQFARFGSKCRTFAPMYRQITLAGLRKRLTGGPISLDTGTAYDDVLSAWKQYLKADNQGRGFVLVSHSQGSFILNRLIHEEIDGKPIQSKMLSAMLLGAPVIVEKGKDVGGTFTKVPLCRKPGQLGCVVNFSSFRSDVPPPANTLFGHTDDATKSGVCTNPVTLGDGSAPLHAYLSNSGRTITGTTALKPWAAGKTIDTPWVSVPGLLTAKCATNEYAAFLEITVNGDPADPRVDDIVGDLGTRERPLANWGLHLIDANLAIGNLLDLVDAQSKAYAAKK